VKLYEVSWRSLLVLLCFCVRTIAMYSRMMLTSVHFYCFRELAFKMGAVLLIECIHVQRIKKC